MSSIRPYRNSVAAKLDTRLSLSFFLFLFLTHSFLLFLYLFFSFSLTHTLNTQTCMSALKTRQIRCLLYIYTRLHSLLKCTYFRFVYKYYAPPAFLYVCKESLLKLKAFAGLHIKIYIWSTNMQVVSVFFVLYLEINIQCWKKWNGNHTDSQNLLI